MTPPSSLGACVAALEAMRFDPADEAAFAEATPLLTRLADDRDFLGTLLIGELGRRGRAQERDNAYGAQVVMLHKGDGWFVRANIWPAADDALLRANGRRRFFYDVPHDHNFTFLTVGYFGPGYVSDYYAYDRDALRGLPGERAHLRFVERATLGRGCTRLYRAHRDVHCQAPPASTSISLNIVQGAAGLGFANQYVFDLSADAVSAQLAHTATEALVALLPELGGPDGQDLLDRFARTHPCARVRFGAIAAQAGAAATLADRAEVLERAARGAPAAVAALVRARLDALGRARAWIDPRPLRTRQSGTSGRSPA